MQEWDLKKNELSNKKIVSIYFGGGTPALLGAKNIERILSAIPLDSSTEITLETNPNIVTLPEMAHYKKIGINRMSLGVQSLHKETLQFLQRTHSKEKALQAIDIIHNFIPNLSIDLMYDIPHQTLTSWQETLSYLPKLPITHISLYNLTFEPETPFFSQKKILEDFLPPSKESLSLLTSACSFLEKEKFLRYEIASFAKNGLYSHHNIGYWNGRPFLGFGPSAWSYWSKERFSNVSSITTYIQNLSQKKLPVDYVEKLQAPNDVIELFILHLRLLQGFSLIDFKKQHGILPKETLDTLKMLTQEKLLSITKDWITLTKKGVLFYDHIAVELLA